ncbi:MAG: aminomethyl-transferring glycine dehydrogenase subunit GcvPA [Candidatus Aminicenantes bacterium]
MSKGEKFYHPYIPNSSPKNKAEMLKELGIKNIEELYADIPPQLRFKGRMNLPAPLRSECALERHVRGILSRNQSCEENISFLGGGCWPHYVPAICDQINQRSEFLTAYAGEPYEDHGRFQALFEYQSLMAELVDMDVVNVPTYDWSQAASTSLSMASRITRRQEILAADTIAPDRLMVIRNYCQPVLKITMVKHSSDTGLMDIEDLKSKISSSTAAVYFENPSYLGFIETQGQEISDLAHGQGALSVVGVDPISLGILVPPSHYGADLVCGDIQPLGNHMHYGGGLGGFIAAPDEERFVMEYPSRLFGITRTSVEGEYGFGDVAYERTSFAEREKGKEFVGTHAALCGITAGVYLALLGPRGIQELSRSILQKSRYAAARLSEIEGVKAPVFKSPHFKEFVVDFRGTGRTVADINRELRKKHIFGGKDLSKEFPQFKNCALYCVTEIHTREDIDTLVQALNKILAQEIE